MEQAGLRRPGLASTVPGIRLSLFARRTDHSLMARFVEAGSCMRTKRLQKSVRCTARNPIELKRIDRNPGMSASSTRVRFRNELIEALA
jgi:hypothetical protein